MNIRYNKSLPITDKVNWTYDQGKNEENKMTLSDFTSLIAPGIGVYTPWENR